MRRSRINRFRLSKQFPIRVSAFEASHANRRRAECERGGGHNLIPHIRSGLRNESAHICTAICPVRLGYRREHTHPGPRLITHLLPSASALPPVHCSPFQLPSVPFCTTQVHDIIQLFLWVGQDCSHIPSSAISRRLDPPSLACSLLKCSGSGFSCSRWLSGNVQPAGRGAGSGFGAPFLPHPSILASLFHARARCSGQLRSDIPPDPLQGQTRGKFEPVNISSAKGKLAKLSLPLQNISISPQLLYRRPFTVRNVNRCWLHFQSA